MESLLTAEEVAEGLRVDVVTVRRLVGRGELAAYRVGGEYRFELSDIEDYLARHRIPVRDRSVDGRFDRFTEQAQEVLALAQEEARLLNHNYLGTEHLLLGLLREDAAARLLRSLGVELTEVRAVVEDKIGRGQDQPAGGELPLTPRSKKVLERAAKEAAHFKHDRIGTDHLILGLLRVGDGVAAKVLSDLGVQPSQARRAVEQHIGGQC